MFLKLKKYLSTAITLSMLYQFILPVEVCVQGKTIKEKIQQNEKNINDLSQKRATQNKNQKDLENKISILNREINALTGQIKALKRENNNKQDEINALLSKVNNVNAQIKTIDTEIEQLTNNSKEVCDQLLKLLKHIYIYGDNNFIELFLSSENFVDFVNSAKYTQKFSEHTKQLLESYESKIKEIDIMKNLKEQELQKIDIHKKEIEQNINHNNDKTIKIEELMQNFQSKYNELGSFLKQTKQQTKTINDAIRTYEKTKRKLEKEMQDSTSAINKAIAEQTQREASAAPSNAAPSNTAPAKAAAQNPKAAEKQTQQNTAGSKNHIYPVQGSSSISTHFGKGHPGIDIQTFGKPNPVVASKSGTVIIASRGGKGNKLSGYGNVIVISHGNGETTLYGHLSSVKVSVGQKVNQGQVIGNVGNTGRVYGRTGMHLHYEQQINNRKISPRISK